MPRDSILLIRKLCKSRTAQAFAGLYVLEILEILLLAFILVTAPRWFLPVAILTQTAQLLVATTFLALVWKNGVMKVFDRWREHRYARNNDR